MTATLTNPNINPNPQPDPTLPERPRELEFGIVPVEEARLTLGALTGYLYQRRVEKLFKKADSPNQAFYSSLGRMAAIKLNEASPQPDETFVRSRNPYRRHKAHRVAKTVDKAVGMKAEVGQAIHDRNYLNIYESIVGGKKEVDWRWRRQKRRDLKDQLKSGQISKIDHRHKKAHVKHMKSGLIHKHYRSFEPHEYEPRPSVERKHGKKLKNLHDIRNKISRKTKSHKVNRYSRRVRRQLPRLQRAHSTWNEGIALGRRQIAYHKNDWETAKKAGRLARDEGMAFARRQGAYHKNDWETLKNAPAAIKNSPLVRGYKEGRESINPSEAFIQKRINKVARFAGKATTRIAHANKKRGDRGGKLPARS